MPRQRSPHLLIQTKLNRPMVGEGWVQRPRLISRLDEGLKSRVTLISAPPGFGKTTLAVQWLHHSNRGVQDSERLLPVCRRGKQPRQEDRRSDCCRADKKLATGDRTNDMHSNFIGMGPAADYTPFTLNDDATSGGYARLAALIARRKDARKDKGPVLVLEARDYSCWLTLFPRTWRGAAAMPVGFWWRKL